MRHIKKKQKNLKRSLTALLFITGLCVSTYLHGYQQKQCAKSQNQHLHGDERRRRQRLDRNIILTAVLHRRNEDVCLRSTKVLRLRPGRPPLEKCEGKIFALAFIQKKKDFGEGLWYAVSTDP